MLSASRSQTDSSVSSALFAVGFFMKAREGVETEATKRTCVIPMTGSGLLFLYTYSNTSVGAFHNQG